MSHLQVISFIKNQIQKGNTGCATMKLYERGFSTLAINKAIRSLVESEKIAVSYGGGYIKSTKESFEKEGLERVLRSKSFEIRMQKNGVLE